MTTKIALVEDSLADARLFKAILVRGNPPFIYDEDDPEKQRAAELVTFSSPPRSIQDYAPFAGVILDRQLPGADGVEEASRIRYAFPNKPLMLLTGSIPNLTAEERGLFVAVAEKDDITAVWDGVRELMRAYSGKEK
jgi:CheY-like chemotaxis protein